MGRHVESCRCKSRYAWLILCLGVGINLGVSQGCARPDAFHRSDGGASSPAVEQNLPFHQTPERAADDSARPAVPEDRKAGTTAPFRTAANSNARSLPAGMLITVRLDSSLSISRVHAGDIFSASVAGPITLDGDMIVERGTPVTGRIESAQPSVDRPGLSPDPGFVRLTLNAINVDGSSVPLQTSSLFAKGALPANTLPVSSGSNPLSGGFRVQKGRHLTFRLTAPVTLANPNSIADRKYTSPASE
ncbi:MAG: hypothetical protein WB919_01435 [Candidatus Sulfotelmatobacter sp.]